VQDGAVPGFLSERDLVPYEASVFPPRTALVLAPHFDDEVFGCGGAIASLRRAGADVHVLVLTDGAGEEPDLARRAAIASVRRAESEAAVASLGGAKIHAAGFPDRGLSSRLSEAADAIRSLAASLRPGIVFVPSPVEVHPDHRAAAAAFLSVARAAAGDPFGSAAVAFYEVSQPFRPNFLLDTTPYRSAFEAAMAAFTSQLEGHDYAEFIRGMRAYRRMTLPREVEAAEGFFVLGLPELRRADPARLAAVIGPSIPPGRLNGDEDEEGGPGGLASFFRSLFRRPARGTARGGSVGQANCFSREGSFPGVRSGGRLARPPWRLP
jgi:LmbE family N-acetylglucosaminyl deacetylase